MSLPQENNDFLWRIVDLPNAEVINYILELGYEIRSTRGIESTDKDTKEMTLVFRYIELWKDGKQLYSDEDTEYAGNEERCGIEDKTPAKLFSYVAAYLNEHENPEKVDWIRKNFSPEPTEIPPWKRYNKTPSKNIPTRNYFKFGETAATQEEIENIIRSANDLGNAERFYEECSNDLIFDIESKEWYCRKINHWEKATSEIPNSQNYVAQTIHAEYKEIENLYAKEATKEAQGAQPILPIPLLKEAVNKMKKLTDKTPNAKNMADMVNLAKGRMNIELNDDLKKESTKYIACKNGIIDTLTGEFIENWEKEKVEKILLEYPLNYVDCVYTPGQKSNLFLEHLRTIFYDNTSEQITEDIEKDIEIKTHQMNILSDYFLKYVSSTLYPGNKNRSFQFWWGIGKNGKSVTVSVLKDIFKGLYADPSIQELYVTDKDIPRSSTANALEKRIAFFSEAEDDENEYRGGRISSRYVKNLTGDNKTTAFRKCHKDAKESYIICTPIGITNQIPHFDKDLDQATIDRIIIIPFKHRFTKEETKENYHEELLKEKDKIFSMIIDVYISLTKKNMELPEAPDFIRMDQQRLLAGYPYNEYVESNIVKVPDSEAKLRQNRITRKILETDYIIWCRNHELEFKSKIGYDGVERLIESEKKKLFKAMRVYGWEEKKSNGNRYFSSCVLRKQC